MIHDNVSLSKRIKITQITAKPFKLSLIKAKHKALRGSNILLSSQFHYPTPIKA